MTIVPLTLPARSNPSRFGYESESRLINAYSEPLGVDAKAQFAIYATEGLDTYATPSSDGGIKCLFPTENYLYGVAGRKVFALDVNLAVTILATLTVAGDSFMDQNRRSPTPEVGLVSNAEYRVITGVAIALVTTNLIAPPTSISSRDGFLILTQNFGRYQITGEDNATTLSVLDFGKAQRVADEIVRVMATETDIILFGTRSMEWHSNQPTGTGTFPFVPIAQKNVGIIGVKAATRLDDLIAFVANDGTVRLVEGYGASIISTPAVQRAIGAVEDKSTIEATSWNSLTIGHKFVALSCADFTWVYDLTTQNWHERKSKGINRWRVSHVCEWNGVTIAGDYADGRLYKLNGNLASESGEELAMTVQVPPTDATPYGLECNELVVDVIPGQGLVGEDTPLLVMDYSDDGGRTWSTERTASLGTAGETNVRINYTRLGQIRRNGRTFRLRCSAATMRGMTGAFLDVEKVK